MSGFPDVHVIVPGDGREGDPVRSAKQVRFDPRARRAAACAALIAASVAGPLAAPAWAGAAAPSSGPSLSATPTTAPATTPTAAPPRIPAPRLAARDLTGQTVDVRTVVLQGTGLDDVATVSLGSASLGAPRHLSATRIAVRVGPAPRFVPATLRLVLHRASDGVPIRTAVRYRYVATTFRARELRWAWVHLEQRSYTWGHPYIYKYDCANFSSHSLVAAGMTDSVLDVSSTSLRRKLIALGATELRDSQRNRARVRIGDLIQFDWQPRIAAPGDRDHTGIVTGIERTASGALLVRYSAHTDGGNDPAKQLQIERTMDRPHHDPHGKVYFLHLPV
jgi:hypothetical protein